MKLLKDELNKYCKSIGFEQLSANYCDLLEHEINELMQLCDPIECNKYSQDFFTILNDRLPQLTTIWSKLNKVNAFIKAVYPTREDIFVLLDKSVDLQKAIMKCKNNGSLNDYQKEN